MGKTGRPPEAGTPRDRVIPIRMSAAEVEHLDQARGTETRSDYVREAVLRRTQE